MSEHSGEFNKDELNHARLWYLRQEWSQENEGTYNSGQVVAIELDPNDRRKATLYYDGGRRRLGENGQEGTVLEAIRTTTKRITEHEIRVGDVVTTGWAFHQPERLVPRERLEEDIDMRNSLPKYNPDDGIGILVWNNDGV